MWRGPYIGFMASSEALDLKLLPGARELLAWHERELPQRDDLCGAFCGALALGAAGIERWDDERIDQDTVALAAGSVVSRIPDTGSLPHGERGRRDYRLSIPLIDEEGRSGTSAGGLAQAIEEISAARLAAIPYAGPWTADTLAGLFDLLAALPRAVTLVANIATRHLWGSSAPLALMLDHLLGGELAGPPADWDVGHYACVIGRASGPGGALYAIADTYPSLGSSGVHVQPGELLARALERREMPAGGMFAVVSRDDAPAVRAGAEEIGLREEIWDNGTVIAKTPR
ncbi:MAG: hypothetical protein QOI03_166 [Solirubrobacteraceae bacterium]|jgi:hypothetical protein|nr:hypothetical protein [Solirubrobacteraceae bacterium]